MESRQIPLESLDDFFQLLTLNSDTSHFDLLEDYRDALKGLIKSVDDGLDLLANVPVILKDKILDEYFYILKGVIGSKDKYRELIHQRPLGVHAIVRAAEKYSESKSLDVEAFVGIATLYHHLQFETYPTIDKYYYKNEHPIKPKGYIFGIFKRLLKENQATINAVTADHFSSILYAAKDFAIELLQYRNLIDILFNGPLTLEGFVAIIKANSSTVVEELVTRHPDEVVALFKSTTDVRQFCSDNTNRSSLQKLPKKNAEKIAELFSSPGVLDDWLWLAQEYDSCEDGTFMAMLTAAISGEDHRGFVAGNQLTTKAMHHLFSNAENLIKVVGISPGFTRAIVRKIDNTSYFEYNRNPNKEPVVDPKSFFTEPETFWQFLQAGGMSLQLAPFTQSVFIAYPKHVKYVYEHSQHFTGLDKKFILAMMTDPGMSHDDFYFNRAFGKVLRETKENVTYLLENFPSVVFYVDLDEEPKRLIHIAKSEEELLALVKCGIFKLNDCHTTCQIYLKEFIQSPECQIPDMLQAFASPGDALVRLAQANHYLASILIEHHTERMLRLLDLKSFSQLESQTRDAFIKHARAAIVALYVDEKVSVDEFFSNFKDTFYYDVSFYHEIIKEQPATIAKKFISSDQKCQFDIIKKHPTSTDVLFERAPFVIAQTFSGKEFVALLTYHPIAAAKLLNNCKDNVKQLIPDAECLALVNKKNSMLMKQFTK